MTSVCAELHCNIRKETGAQLGDKSGMAMYQNQSKRVMKVSLPYFGTNKVQTYRTIANNKPRELLLTINRTP